METIGMVEIIGMGLMGIGGLVAFAASIMILIQAFKESVLWGLGYIFIPFVSLIFVVMHWDQTMKPFLVSLAGGALLGVGVVISSL
jgi:hypothetical protein